MGRLIRRASPVHLNAGFPLAEVKSPHHAVKIDRPDSTTRVIRLADGAGAGGQGFRAHLEGGGAMRRRPGCSRRCVGGDYLLAFVTPPAAQQADAEAAAARSGVRARQFRLDGRHIDQAGQGQPDFGLSQFAAGPTAST